VPPSALAKAMAKIEDGGQVAAHQRIPFLGLTGSGLDDIDAYMIAKALSVTPPRNTEQISSKPDTLELLQIAFNPESRASLMDEREKANMRVLVSSPKGPALRGRP
jgi:hypothetical protein